MHNSAASLLAAAFIGLGSTGCSDNVRFKEATMTESPEAASRPTSPASTPATPPVPPSAPATAVAPQARPQTPAATPAGAQATTASSSAQPAPPAAGAATAAATQVPGLSIKRLLFAKDVVDREPVEPGTSFSRADTDKVWLFLELENQNAALTLDVSFAPEASPVRTQGVTLSVPQAKRYRTRAFTRTDKTPGRYRCVVRTQDGVVIADEIIEIRA